MSLEHLPTPARRVIHGGCWDDSAWGARSAYRGRYEPGDRDAGLGFRPAAPAGRVGRGGGWRDAARIARSADRGRGELGGRDADLGFRPAADANVKGPLETPGA
jgi:formylglycine-generating enzyme required for sulfatase activity